VGFLRNAMDVLRSDYLGVDGRPVVFTSLYDGRIGRLRFFLYLLLIGAIALVLAFLKDAGVRSSDEVLWLLVIPGFMIFTKRLHDLNLSGWWNLIWILPFVVDAGLTAILQVPNWLGNLLLWGNLGAQIVFLLGLLVIPGSRTANRFGASPFETPQPATKP
jgi:uncharacterized membrane protein YhaH (DUF805 family)